MTAVDTHLATVGGLVHLGDRRGAGVLAQRSDAFVDSIGVCTHLKYGNTPYVDDWTNVKTRLGELGIRHIRDGWGTGDPTAETHLNELYTAYGITMTMVTDARETADPATIVAHVDANIADEVDMYEGPNEWDVNGGLSYNGKNWPGAVADWMADLRVAVDASANPKPIVAPSIAQTYATGVWAALGDIDDTCDYGNAHPYPGNRSQYIDDIGETINRLNDLIAPGRLGIIPTETGFCTKTQSANGDNWPIPPDQQGPTMVRLFLEHFRPEFGMPRTFAYEFCDEHDIATEWEDGLGMLYFDTSPKPSFVQLKRLIGFCASAAQFTPGWLDYRLSGGNGGTKTLLLQKTATVFQLFVWQQNKLYDGPTTTVLDPADESVDLEFRDARGVAVTEHEFHGTDTTQVADHGTGLTSLPSMTANEYARAFEITVAA